MTKRRNPNLPSNRIKDLSSMTKLEEGLYYLVKYDVVFSEEYYHIYKNIVTKFKKEHTLIDELVKGYVDKFIDSMLSNPGITNPMSSFYELISYPIFAGLIKNKKKINLSDFNIRLDFMKTMMSYNLDANSNNESFITLVWFNFGEHGKLQEFQTTVGNGIIQHYNKDYKIEKIIFADGKEEKIPL